MVDIRQGERLPPEIPASNAGKVRIMMRVVLETIMDCADVVIRTRRIWNRMRLRNACISNELYTCGDNSDYERMLDMVERMAPDTGNMYLVASDICKHSKDQTVTNIMFILESEVIITTFEINGSEEY